MDEDGDINSMPIITLEVMSESSQAETVPEIQDAPSIKLVSTQDVGMHFLTEKTQEISVKDEKDVEVKESPRGRSDLLEYVIRSDGSVICKLCGEILQSRTHWYRHKYKLHVVQPPPLNPAPLFQCEQCLVYFKSRKGYIGHLASRHSEVLSDSSPVISHTQTQLESNSTKEKTPTQNTDPKESLEPEIAVSNVTNYQATVVRQLLTKTNEAKKPTGKLSTTKDTNQVNSDEKRSREEKLVADIIDRVRRECEAQGGSGSAARRGYNRRTTVMHT